MVQPPDRSPQEKIIRNKSGGLFILCSDGNYCGMYPASLSELINSSFAKAKYIIDLLELIVENLDLNSSDKLSEYIVNLNDAIPDPPEQDAFQEFVSNPKKVISKSNITTLDVAEILEISYEFAAELYNSFDGVIEDEDDLMDFLVHVDKYLTDYYNGVIPQEHQKNKKKKPLTSQKQKSQFDTKRIEEILRQEAPPELRPDSLIQPVTEEEFDADEELNKQISALKEEKQSNQKDYSHENFAESPHFETACKTLEELLDLNNGDAKTLLTSPETIAKALDIDDMDIVKQILNDAANGNMETLLDAIGTQVDDVLSGSSTPEGTEADVSLETISDGLLPIPQPPPIIDTQPSNNITAPIKGKKSSDTAQAQLTEEQQSKSNNISNLETIAGTVKDNNTNISTPQNIKSDEFGVFSNPDDMNISAKNQAMAPEDKTIPQKEQAQEKKATDKKDEPDPQAYADIMPKRDVLPDFDNKPDRIPKHRLHKSTPIQNSATQPENQQPKNDKTKADLSQTPPTPKKSGKKVKEKEEDQSVEIPDNFPDALRLCYKLKDRVTSKSLAESFALFDIDISQALARFIIEEGGYGGAGSNSHRIMTKRMVEKLISDIAEEASLRDFVKIYLKKINNDLKSMLGGG